VNYTLEYGSKVLWGFNKGGEEFVYQGGQTWEKKEGKEEKTQISKKRDCGWAGGRFLKEAERKVLATVNTAVFWGKGGRGEGVLWFLYFY